MSSTALDEKIKLPVDDDTNDLVNGLLAQLRAKQPRNELRSAYYDGKRILQRLGSVLPPEYLRMGVVLGWSAKAVDTLAQRCNLDALVWPDGDLNSVGLREAWDANLVASESNSGMVSSLLHGTSFLINTTGGELEPAALLHTKDALSATGEWNTRTRRLTNLLSVVERDTEGKPSELALYEYNSTMTALRGDDGKWSVDFTDHSWGVPCEALTFKPRTGRPFGYSRISRAVMSAHDRAMKACVRLEAHADIYSIPMLVLLGADESIFKNSDGTVKSAWKIALGRVFALPDDEELENPRADLKTVQAQSPAPQIDVLKQIAQQFCAETSIPLASLGVADLANPTSADAYHASREDLIAAAETAVDDWRPAFKRAMQRMLAMQNGETSVPQRFSTIDCKFRSPLHLSRAAEADAGSKQVAAAPWLAETEVGLELLGLTEQQITRALSEKRRAAGRATVALLAQRLQQPVEEQGVTENAAAGGAG